MPRPHLEYSRPPSVGPHGLRRTSALAAHDRVVQFLERATDAIGAFEVAIDFGSPGAGLLEQLCATWGGRWHSDYVARWTGPRRTRPSDPPAGVPYAALRDALAQLADAGWLHRVYVRYEALLCDPRGAAPVPLPYVDEPFSRHASISELAVALDDGRASTVRLALEFPDLQFTGGVVAVHDAAVDTMGIAFGEYWYAVRPSVSGTTSGTATKVVFDRRTWRDPDPAAAGPRTGDEAALLAAIRAAPDDDAPRLVYADALAQRGDARGELIALQCRLARLGPDAPERRALVARERELFEANRHDWSLPPGLRAGWRRGFIDEIFAQTAGHVTRARDYLSAFAPLVEKLRIRRGFDRHDARALGALGALDAALPLATLAIRPEPGGLPALAATPLWARLRRLELESPAAHSGAEFAAVLCDGPRPPRLATVVVIGEASPELRARLAERYALTD